MFIWHLFVFQITELGKEMSYNITINRNSNISAVNSFYTVFQSGKFEIISKDGKADVDKFAYLYTGHLNKKGVPEMLRGYRDVPSMFFCRRDLRGVYYDRKALFSCVTKSRS
jgi:hypothetical protein